MCFSDISFLLCTSILTSAACQVRNLTKSAQETDPQNWLEKVIKTKEQSKHTILDIPLQTNREEYTVDMLFDDQLQVYSVIMAKIKEWMTTEDLTNFKPLRMILNGAGGCGKSVVINSIVTTLRKMFHDNEVVRVVAPTGAAAFNVGGETLHHLLGMGVGREDYIPETMSTNKQKKLIKKLKKLLVLFIDERSLLQYKDFGTSAQMIRETIFDASRMNETWGGLPVLVLVGDDYQLPAIGDGVISAWMKPLKKKMAIIGKNAMFECAEFVMELKKSRRLIDANKDAGLLERLRIGKHITDADVAKLTSLHLNEIQKKHGKEVVAEIKKNAVYLFYHNAKKDQHNYEMLAQQSDSLNPVARLLPNSTSHHGTKAIRSHFNSASPDSVYLCRNAAVCLAEKNIYPSWGLHSGACGRVDEIVFKEGTNPNNGDMPLYIVVDFPLYKGPIWDIDNPTAVPIPFSTYRCRYQCCERQYYALQLAYARTIHKFQGLTAGPSQPGRPRNPYECIICDPGTKQVEGRSPGILYTSTSRGSTFGDESGLHSALYFDGDDFDEQRIYGLTKKKNSDENFLFVVNRDEWVQYLNKRTKQNPHTNQEMLDVKKWVKKTKWTIHQLEERIETYIKSQKKSTGSKRKK